jgi:TonB family protein
MIAAAVLLVATFALQTPALPGDRLASAKLLYASGAYEDALARLSSIDVGETPDAGQVRALCLLALGRTSDARRSLEDIVVRRPLFRLLDSDVSPQLTALFAEARRKALPEAVRAMYARGRASFDAQQHADAILQLREMMLLLSDADLADQAASLQDYRMLAEGFIQLSEAKVQAARRGEEPLPASGASPPDTTSPATTTVLVIPAGPSSAGVNPLAPRIYGPDDPGVLAPVEVTRPMPPWYPPTAADQAREHRGVLRIVIDERGYVEAAALVTSVHEAYDPALLAATKYWKFRPAVRDGRAVKFAKIIEVILAGR